MTTTERTAALNKHNTLREKVASGNQSPQPSGSNMNKLVWDAGIAEVAQEWADTLANANSFYHRSDSASVFPGKSTAFTKGSTKSLGENIAYSTASGYSCVDATQNWYDEVTAGMKNAGAYTYKKLNWDIDKNFGHYTQIVWAKTRYIGCGFATNSAGRRYCVCNYYPPGNYGGEYPYISGTGGANCEGDRTKEGNLCGGCPSRDFLSKGATGTPKVDCDSDGNSGGNTGDTAEPTKSTPSPTKKPTVKGASSDSQICVTCVNKGLSASFAKCGYLEGTYTKSGTSKIWKLNNYAVAPGYGSDSSIKYYMYDKYNVNNRYSWMDVCSSSINSIDKCSFEWGWGFEISLGACGSGYTNGDSSGITYLFKDTGGVVLVIIVVVQCIIITIFMIVCITKKINDKKLKKPAETADYHQL